MTFSILDSFIAFMVDSARVLPFSAKSPHTSSLICFCRTTLAAAKDKSSPPNVPETKTFSISSIISFLPTTAASGNPLAIPLPNVAKSGVTLNCS